MWNYIGQNTDQNDYNGQVWNFHSTLSTGRDAYVTIDGTANPDSSDTLQQQMPQLLRSMGQSVEPGAFDQAVDVDNMKRSQIYQDYLNGTYTGPTSDSNASTSEVINEVLKHSTISLDAPDNGASVTQLPNVAAVDPQRLLDYAKENANGSTDSTQTSSDATNDSTTSSKNADSQAVYETIKNDTYNKMTPWASDDEKGEMLKSVPAIWNDISTKTDKNDKTGNFFNYALNTSDGRTVYYTVDGRVLPNGDKYEQQMPAVLNSLGKNMTKGELDQAVNNDILRSSKAYSDYQQKAQGNLASNAATTAAAAPAAAGGGLGLLPFALLAPVIGLPLLGLGLLGLPVATAGLALAAPIVLAAGLPLIPLILPIALLAPALLLAPIVLPALALGLPLILGAKLAFAPLDFLNTVVLSTLGSMILTAPITLFNTIVGVGLGLLNTLLGSLPLALLDFVAPIVLNFAIVSLISQLAQLTLFNALILFNLAKAVINGIVDLALALSFIGLPLALLKGLFDLLSLGLGLFNAFLLPLLAGALTFLALAPLAILNTILLTLFNISIPLLLGFFISLLLSGIVSGLTFLALLGAKILKDLLKDAFRFVLSLIVAGTILVGLPLLIVAAQVLNFFVLLIANAVGGLLIWNLLTLAKSLMLTGLGIALFSLPLAGQFLINTLVKWSIRAIIHIFRFFVGAIKLGARLVLSFVLGLLNLLAGAATAGSAITALVSGIAAALTALIPVVGPVLALLPLLISLLSIANTLILLPLKLLLGLAHALALGFFLLSIPAILFLRPLLGLPIALGAGLLSDLLMPLLTLPLVLFNQLTLFNLIFLPLLLLNLLGSFVVAPLLLNGLGLINAIALPFLFALAALGLIAILGLLLLSLRLPLVALFLLGLPSLIPFFNLIMDAIFLAPLMTLVNSLLNLFIAIPLMMFIDAIINLVVPFLVWLTTLLLLAPVFGPLAFLNPLTWINLPIISFIGTFLTKLALKLISLPLIFFINGIMSLIPAAVVAFLVGLLRALFGGLPFLLLAPLFLLPLILNGFLTALVPGLNLFTVPAGLGALLLGLPLVLAGLLNNILGRLIWKVLSFVTAYLASNVLKDLLTLLTVPLLIDLLTPLILFNKFLTTQFLIFPALWLGLPLLAQLLTSGLLWGLTFLKDFARIALALFNIGATLLTLPLWTILPVLNLLRRLALVFVALVALPLRLLKDVFDLVRQFVEIGALLLLPLLVGIPAFLLLLPLTTLNFLGLKLLNMAVPLVLALLATLAASLLINLLTFIGMLGLVLFNKFVELGAKLLLLGAITLLILGALPILLGGAVLNSLLLLALNAFLAFNAWFITTLINNLLVGALLLGLGLLPLVAQLLINTAVKWTIRAVVHLIRFFIGLFRLGARLVLQFIIGLINLVLGVATGISLLAGVANLLLAPISLLVPLVGPILALINLLNAGLSLLNLLILLPLKLLAMLINGLTLLGLLLSIPYWLFIRPLISVLLALGAGIISDIVMTLLSLPLVLFNQLTLFNLIGIPALLLKAFNNLVVLPLLLNGLGLALALGLPLALLLGTLGALGLLNLGLLGLGFPLIALFILLLPNLIPFLDLILLALNVLGLFNLISSLLKLLLLPFKIFLDLLNNLLLPLLVAGLSFLFLLPLLGVITFLNPLRWLNLAILSGISTLLTTLLLNLVLLPLSLINNFLLSLIPAVLNGLLVGLLRALFGGLPFLLLQLGLLLPLILNGLLTALVPGLNLLTVPLGLLALLLGLPLVLAGILNNLLKQLVWTIVGTILTQLGLNLAKDLLDLLLWLPLQLLLALPLFLLNLGLNAFLLRPLLLFGLPLLAGLLTNLALVVFNLIRRGLELLAELLTLGGTLLTLPLWTILPGLNFLRKLVAAFVAFVALPLKLLKDLFDLIRAAIELGAVLLLPLLVGALGFLLLLPITIFNFIGLHLLNMAIPLVLSLLAAIAASLLVNFLTLLATLGLMLLNKLIEIGAKLLLLGAITLLILGALPILLGGAFINSLLLLALNAFLGFNLWLITTLINNLIVGAFLLGLLLLPLIGQLVINTIVKWTIRAIVHLIRFFVGLFRLGARLVLQFIIGMVNLVLGAARALSLLNGIANLLLAPLALLVPIVGPVLALLNLLNAGLSFLNRLILLPLKLLAMLVNGLTLLGLLLSIPYWLFIRPLISVALAIGAGIISDIVMTLLSLPLVLFNQLTLFNLFGIPALLLKAFNNLVLLPLLINGIGLILALGLPLALLLGALGLINLLGLGLLGLGFPLIALILLALPNLIPFLDLIMLALNLFGLFNLLLSLLNILLLPLKIFNDLLNNLLLPLLVAGLSFLLLLPLLGVITFLNPLRWLNLAILSGISTLLTQLLLNLLLLPLSFINNFLLSLIPAVLNGLLVGLLRALFGGLPFLLLQLGLLLPLILNGLLTALIPGLNLLTVPLGLLALLLGLPLVVLGILNNLLKQLVWTIVGTLLTQLGLNLAKDLLDLLLWLPLQLLLALPLFLLNLALNAFILRPLLLFGLPLLAALLTNLALVAFNLIRRGLELLAELLTLGATLLTLPLWTILPGLNFLRRLLAGLMILRIIRNVIVGLLKMLALIGLPLLATLLFAPLSLLIGLGVFLALTALNIALPILLALGLSVLLGLAVQLLSTLALIGLDLLNNILKNLLKLGLLGLLALGFVFIVLPLLLLGKLLNTIFLLALNAFIGFNIWLLSSLLKDLALALLAGALFFGPLLGAITLGAVTAIAIRALVHLIRFFIGLFRLGARFVLSFILGLLRNLTRLIRLANIGLGLLNAFLAIASLLLPIPGWLLAPIFALLALLNLANELLLLPIQLLLDLLGLLDLAAWIFLTIPYFLFVRPLIGLLLALGAGLISHIISFLIGLPLFLLNELILNGLITLPLFLLKLFSKFIVAPLLINGLGLLLALGTALAVFLAALNLPILLFNALLGLFNPLLAAILLGLPSLIPFLNLAMDLAFFVPLFLLVFSLLKLLLLPLKIFNDLLKNFFVPLLLALALNVLNFFLFNPLNPINWILAPLLALVGTLLLQGLLGLLALPLKLLLDLAISAIPAAIAGFIVGLLRALLGGLPFFLLMNLALLLPGLLLLPLILNGLLTALIPLLNLLTVPLALLAALLNLPILLGLLLTGLGILKNIIDQIFWSIVANLFTYFLTNLILDALAIVLIPLLLNLLGLLSFLPLTLFNLLIGFPLLLGLGLPLLLTLLNQFLLTLLNGLLRLGQILLDLFNIALTFLTSPIWLLLPLLHLLRRVLFWLTVPLMILNLLKLPFDILRRFNHILLNLALAAGLGFGLGFLLGLPLLLLGNLISLFNLLNVMLPLILLNAFGPFLLSVGLNLLLQLIPALIFDAIMAVLNTLILFGPLGLPLRVLLNLLGIALIIMHIISTINFFLINPLLILGDINIAVITFIFNKIPTFLILLGINALINGILWQLPILLHEFNLILHTIALIFLPTIVRNIAIIIAELVAGALGLVLGIPGVILNWLLNLLPAITVFFELYWLFEIVANGILFALNLIYLAIAWGIVGAINLFVATWFAMFNSIAGWIILNLVLRFLANTLILINDFFYFINSVLGLAWSLLAALLVINSLLLAPILTVLNFLLFNLLLPLLMGLLAGFLIGNRMFLIIAAIVALPIIILLATFFLLFLLDWLINNIPNTLIVAFFFFINTIILTLAKIVVDKVISYIAGLALLATVLSTLGLLALLALGLNLLVYALPFIVMFHMIRFMFPGIMLFDLLPSVSSYLFFYLIPLYFFSSLLLPGLGFLLALALPAILKYVLFAVFLAMPATLPFVILGQLLIDLIRILTLLPINLFPNFLSPLRIFRYLIFNPIGLAVNYYRHLLIFTLIQTLSIWNWIDPIRLFGRLLFTLQLGFTLFNVLLLPEYTFVFQIAKQAILQFDIIDKTVLLSLLGAPIFALMMIPTAIATAIGALIFLPIGLLFGNILQLPILILVELINTPIMFLASIGIIYNLLQIFSRFASPFFWGWITKDYDMIGLGTWFFTVGGMFWDVIKHSFTVHVLGFAVSNLVFFGAQLLPLLIPNTYFRVLWTIWNAGVIANLALYHAVQLLLFRVLVVPAQIISGLVGWLNAVIYDVIEIVDIALALITLAVRIIVVAISLIGILIPGLRLSPLVTLLNSAILLGGNLIVAQIALLVLEPKNAIVWYLNWFNIILLAKSFGPILFTPLALYAVSTFILGFGTINKLLIAALAIVFAFTNPLTFLMPINFIIFFFEFIIGRAILNPLVLSIIIQLFMDASVYAYQFLLLFVPLAGPILAGLLGLNGHLIVFIQFLLNLVKFTVIDLFIKAINLLGFIPSLINTVLTVLAGLPTLFYRPYDLISVVLFVAALLPILLLDPLAASVPLLLLAGTMLIFQLLLINQIPVYLFIRLLEGTFVSLSQLTPLAALGLGLLLTTNIPAIEFILDVIDHVIGYLIGLVIYVVYLVLNKFIFGFVGLVASAFPFGIPWIPLIAAQTTGINALGFTLIPMIDFALLGIQTVRMLFSLAISSFPIVNLLAFYDLLVGFITLNPLSALFLPIHLGIVLVRVIYLYVLGALNSLNWIVGMVLAAVVEVAAFKIWYGIILILMIIENFLGIFASLPILFLTPGGWYQLAFKLLAEPLLTSMMLPLVSQGSILALIHEMFTFTNTLRLGAPGGLIWWVLTLIVNVIVGGVVGVVAILLDAIIFLVDAVVNLIGWIIYLVVRVLPFLVPAVVAIGIAIGIIGAVFFIGVLVPLILQLILPAIFATILGTIANITTTILTFLGNLILAAPFYLLVDLILPLLLLGKQIGILLSIPLEILNLVLRLTLLPLVFIAAAIAQFNYLILKPLFNLALNLLTAFLIGLLGLLPLLLNTGLGFLLQLPLDLLGFFNLVVLPILLPLLLMGLNLGAPLLAAILGLPIFLLDTFRVLRDINHLLFKLFVQFVLGFPGLLTIGSDIVLGLLNLLNALIRAFALANLLLTPLNIFNDILKNLLLPVLAALPLLLLNFFLFNPLNPINWLLAPLLAGASLLLTNFLLPLVLVPLQQLLNKLLSIIPALIAGLVVPLLRGLLGGLPVDILGKLAVLAAMLGLPLLNLASLIGLLIPGLRLLALPLLILTQLAALPMLLLGLPLLGLLNLDILRNLLGQLIWSVLTFLAVYPLALLLNSLISGLLLPLLLGLLFLPVFLFNLFLNNIVLPLLATFLLPVIVEHLLRLAMNLIGIAKRLLNLFNDLLGLGLTVLTMPIWFFLPLLNIIRRVAFWLTLLVGVPLDILRRLLKLLFDLFIGNPLKLLALFAIPALLGLGALLLGLPLITALLQLLLLPLLAKLLLPLAAILLSLPIKLLLDLLALPLLWLANRLLALLPALALALILPLLLNGLLGLLKLPLDLLGLLGLPLLQALTLFNKILALLNPLLWPLLPLLFPLSWILRLLTLAKVFDLIKDLLGPLGKLLLDNLILLAIPLLKLLINGLELFALINPLLWPLLFLVLLPLGLTLGLLGFPLALFNVLKDLFNLIVPALLTFLIASTVFHLINGIINLFLIPLISGLLTLPLTLINFIVLTALRFPLHAMLLPALLGLITTALLGGFGPLLGLLIAIPVALLDGLRFLADDIILGLLLLPGLIPFRNLLLDLLFFIPLLLNLLSLFNLLRTPLKWILDLFNQIALPLVVMALTFLALIPFFGLISLLNPFKWLRMALLSALTTFNVQLLSTLFLLPLKLLNNKLLSFLPALLNGLLLGFLRNILGGLPLDILGLLALPLLNLLGLLGALTPGLRLLGLPLLLLTQLLGLPLLLDTLRNLIAPLLWGNLAALLTYPLARLINNILSLIGLPLLGLLGALPLFLLKLFNRAFILRPLLLLCLPLLAQLLTGLALPLFNLIRRLLRNGLNLLINGIALLTLPLWLGLPALNLLREALILPALLLTLLRGLRNLLRLLLGTPLLLLGLPLLAGLATLLLGLPLITLLNMLLSLPLLLTFLLPLLAALSVLPLKLLLDALLLPLVFLGSHLLGLPLAILAGLLLPLILAGILRALKLPFDLLKLLGLGLFNLLLPFIPGLDLLTPLLWPLGLLLQPLALADVLRDLLGNLPFDLLNLLLILPLAQILSTLAMLIPGLGLLLIPFLLPLKLFNRFIAIPLAFLRTLGDLAKLLLLGLPLALLGTLLALPLINLLNDLLDLLLLPLLSGLLTLPLFLLNLGLTTLLVFPIAKGVLPFLLANGLSALVANFLPVLAGLLLNPVLVLANGIRLLNDLISTIASQILLGLLLLPGLIPFRNLVLRLLFFIPLLLNLVSLFNLLRTPLKWILDIFNQLALPLAAMALTFAILIPFFGLISLLNPLKWLNMALLSGLTTFNVQLLSTLFLLPLKLLLNNLLSFLPALLNGLLLGFLRNILGGLPLDILGLLALPILNLLGLLGTLTPGLRLLGLPLLLLTQLLGLPLLLDTLRNLIAPLLWGNLAALLTFPLARLINNILSLIGLPLLGLLNALPLFLLKLFNRAFILRPLLLFGLPLLAQLLTGLALPLFNLIRRAIKLGLNLLKNAIALLTLPLWLGLPAINLLREALILPVLLLTLLRGLRNLFNLFLGTPALLLGLPLLNGLATLLLGLPLVTLLNMLLSLPLLLTLLLPLLAALPILPIKILLDLLLLPLVLLGNKLLGLPMAILAGLLLPLLLAGLLRALKLPLDLLKLAGLVLFNLLLPFLPLLNALTPLLWPLGLLLQPLALADVLRDLLGNLPFDLLNLLLILPLAQILSTLAMLIPGLGLLLIPLLLPLKLFNRFIAIPLAFIRTLNDLAKLLLLALPLALLGTLLALPLINLLNDVLSLLLLPLLSGLLTLPLFLLNLGLLTLLVFPIAKGVLPFLIANGLTALLVNFLPVVISLLLNPIIVLANGIRLLNDLLKTINRFILLGLLALPGLIPGLDLLIDGLFLIPALLNGLSLLNLLNLPLRFLNNFLKNNILPLLLALGLNLLLLPIFGPLQFLNPINWLLVPALALLRTFNTKLLAKLILVPGLILLHLLTSLIPATLAAILVPLLRSLLGGLPLDILGLLGLPLLNLAALIGSFIPGIRLLALPLLLLTQLLGLPLLLDTLRNLIAPLLWGALAGLLTYPVANLVRDLIGLLGLPIVGLLSTLPIFLFKLVRNVLLGNVLHLLLPLLAQGLTFLGLLPLNLLRAGLRFLRNVIPLVLALLTMPLWFNLPLLNILRRVAFWALLGLELLTLPFKLLNNLLRNFVGLPLLLLGLPLLAGLLNFLVTLPLVTLATKLISLPLALTLLLPLLALLGNLPVKLLTDLLLLPLMFLGNALLALPLALILGNLIPLVLGALNGLIKLPFDLLGLLGLPLLLALAPLAKLFALLNPLLWPLLPLLNIGTRILRMLLPFKLGDVLKDILGPLANLPIDLLNALVIPGLGLLTLLNMLNPLFWPLLPVLLPLTLTLGLVGTPIALFNVLKDLAKLALPVLIALLLFPIIHTGMNILGSLALPLISGLLTLPLFLLNLGLLTNLALPIVKGLLPFLINNGILLAVAGLPVLLLAPIALLRNLIKGLRLLGDILATLLALPGVLKDIFDLVILPLKMLIKPLLVLGLPLLANGLTFLALTPLMLLNNLIPHLLALPLLGLITLGNALLPILIPQLLLNLLVRPLLTLNNMFLNKVLLPLLFKLAIGIPLIGIIGVPLLLGGLALPIFLLGLLSQLFNIGLQLLSIANILVGTALILGGLIALPFALMGAIGGRSARSVVPGINVETPEPQPVAKAIPSVGFWVHNDPLVLGQSLVEGASEFSGFNPLSASADPQYFNGMDPAASATQSANGVDSANSMENAVEGANASDVDPSDPADPKADPSENTNASGVSDPKLPQTGNKGNNWLYAGWTILLGMILPMILKIKKRRKNHKAGLKLA
ncbi:hypothetical protein [Companilactobacillus mishanensis]|uniref:Uncharacterized protein n=1 Tax=Companilactobacillus mishanensis TaxID=2486008 RepID=A0ABW9P6L7_9LACO|nr:hypothetical protein [Companilactobacillus mishanensis]MQS44754.1 hypothetical protein [Companilactobacillus mishanensis]